MRWRILSSVLWLAAPLWADSYFLEHASVVDVVAGKVERNTNVAVDDGRIIGIGPKVAKPANAHVIDARDKYVIPGLWDMHVHLGDANAAFQAYLANGITAVRDMYPEFPLQVVAQWRTRPDLPRLAIPGFLDGPLMLSGGLPPPGAYAVGNATEARNAVWFIAQSGYDFIKVYNSLPREAYLSIAEQSRAIGIPFAGHVPEAVSPLEASDAGQRSQEHLINILLACSDEEEQLRAERVQVMTTDRLSGEQRMRELGFPNPAPLMKSYNPEKAQKLFAAFVKNGTWQTPTLSLIKSFLDEKVDLRPYVYLRDLDAEGLAGFRARLAMLLDRYKILVRDMHKAGVEFLAGTDSGPQTPNRPGSSLHDELELFVEAGLTPAEALRTATLNPARYFRVEADAGTVEVGKSADLVILDANPLTDIKATRKIRGLMLRGVYYPH